MMHHDHQYPQQQPHMMMQHQMPHMPVYSHPMMTHRSGGGRRW